MHVFFSHSSRDKPLLRELKLHFPSWVEVWLDEDRLLFGSDLEISLKAAIDSDVDYVVLFLGEEAFNSKWVKKEIQWSLKREEEAGRVFLLPVLLIDSRERLSEIGLAGRLTIDFTDFTREGTRSVATKIVAHLGGWLSERIRSTSPARIEKSGSDDQFSSLISSVRDHLLATPSEWRDDVESLLIRPFLRSSLLGRRGEIPLNPSQYYQGILSEIQAADSQWVVSAVSTLSSSLWAEDANQRHYGRKNLEAVSRGTKIRRLFVLPDGAEGTFRALIEDQESAGIDVRAANTKLLADATDLEDLVIFSNPEYSRVYVASAAIDGSKSIRSGRLVVDPILAETLHDSFNSAWDSAIDSDDFFRAVEIAPINRHGIDPPGLSLRRHKLDKPVISCDEAAEAREIDLKNELKTLVLRTSTGFMAVHLPGDGILSLRKVKDFLEAGEAYLADPEDIFSLGLSPGTVSALLDPVWRLPQLISRRVFDQDLMMTNDGTTTGYFKFDPALLTHATDLRIGEFEKGQLAKVAENRELGVEARR